MRFTVISMSFVLLLIPNRGFTFDLSRLAGVEPPILSDSTGTADNETMRPVYLPSDSTKTGEKEVRGSMDLLKEMLDRETGEPSLEGSSWHRKKNPKIAMLSALVFPGLGQIYNEKPFKAMVAMGFEVFYLANILHNYRMEQREIEIRDSYPKYIYIEGDEPIQILNYPWREHNAWAEEYRERQVDFIWWSAGCILVEVLDAYVDSHLHDMNFRIENSPIKENTGISLVIDF
ncbi:MAG: hypothetical protein JW746_03710 [Candidatus Krumholzibacteriota bacterium]|nr:hypothetical protein [Candidatus Krumholzibacteriota bacterium]